MQLYLLLDLSDDDAELTDIANECGYDVRHPAVLDVLAPVVVQTDEDLCLMLPLVMAQSVAPEQLLTQAQISVSHPSVASFKVWLVKPADNTQ